MTKTPTLVFEAYPQQDKVWIGIVIDRKEGELILNGFSVMLRDKLNSPSQGLAVTNGRGSANMTTPRQIGKTKITYKSSDPFVKIGGWLYGNFYFDGKRTLDPNLIKSYLHIEK